MRRDTNRRPARVAILAQASRRDSGDTFNTERIQLANGKCKSLKNIGQNGKPDDGRRGHTVAEDPDGSRPAQSRPPKKVAKHGGAEDAKDGNDQRVESARRHRRRSAGRRDDTPMTMRGPPA